MHVLVIIVNIDNMHGEKLKKKKLHSFFDDSLFLVSFRL